MDELKVVLNQLARSPGDTRAASAFGREEAEAVRAFLRSFSEYAPTPLVVLPHLAARLGLASVMVKDESRRFGLNSFKVVGGAWAMARCLAERMGIPDTDLTLDGLREGLRSTGADLPVFATATDGNHGRGVAWTARQLGCRAKVYLPRGAAPARVEHIRACGAEALVTEGTYDHTVRLMARDAEVNGWLRIQDTDGPGYEQIPLWIMQGYTSIGLEILEQMDQDPHGSAWPTHVFLQAGVGAFAGAILAFLANELEAHQPAAIIVEPSRADCLFRSIQAGDGTIRIADGDLGTIMAGLACGEPCGRGWRIIRDLAKAAAACPDHIAADGMRILASPDGNDPSIIAGESGGVTCGLLEALMVEPGLRNSREALNLGPESRVLLINTEGDTDPEAYREIVWYGRHSRYAG